MAVLTLTMLDPELRESGSVTSESTTELGTSRTTDATATMAEELSYLLFDQEDRHRVHGTWRGLVDGKDFVYRPGLTPLERTALSYERLRLVNGASEGGAELLAYDARRLASLNEWTGFLDAGLCTVASVHYNLFIGSLLDHDGYRRDLSSFTSMKRTGTFLCTELEHGNDVASMETRATFDHETGGFFLDTPTPGAQKFMPNTSLTGGPKTATVAARLIVDGKDQGVFLFLTPLSDETGHLPGVHVRAVQNRTGTPVDHCLTSFERVWLPREALLEAEHGKLGADGKVTSTLGNLRKRMLRSIGRVTTGKLCMSAATLGMARASLGIAVRYAHTRHIAGAKAGQQVPLVAHRSHHSRLLDGIATSYAMTFLHRSVMDRWVGHTKDDQEEVERLIAVAKGWITWKARDITIECRERCGAQGLFPSNGLADQPLSVEGAITAEGDNLVIWLKAASEMLFGHSVDLRDSHDLAPGGRKLTDLNFLRDLLASVEDMWQQRARVAVRQGPSGDPLGRWNETSGPALEMVGAHALVEAADAFIAAAGRTADPAVRVLLQDLCRLFLLRQLREHTGDLLAEGRMTVHHVRELPGAVEAAMARLAPHMLTLVEAFDLPEEWLAGTPIAHGSAVGMAEGTAAAC